MDPEKIEQTAMLQDIVESDKKKLEPEDYYFDGEMFKFNRFIIENDKETLPVDFAKNFWAFMDKEMTLSNLDNEDIKKGLLWYDIDKIDFMMGIPDYKFTFEMSQNIDQGRFKALVKMKRSFGPDRERVMLATSIKDIRTTDRGARPPGIFDRLLGRR